MPLIFLAAVLLGALSWLVLGAAGYLLWTGWQGELLRDLDGDLVRMREDWRLWTGAALLAWSLGGGRLILPWLLARGDERPPTKPERAPGRTIIGGSGATLHVEEAGLSSGPTLVLTHGWGLDSTIWSYAKRDLGDRFRLLLWDLPGLGRSRPAPDGAISPTDFAADLASVADLADGPVVLVGHSIGGMTIQTLARERPELFGRKVAGVVLLNTTYTNPLKTMILSGLVQALRWPLLEPLLRLTIWLQPLAWLSAWQSYFSGSAHLANRLGFGRYATRSQLEHTTLLAIRNPPGASAKGNLAMFRWDAGQGPERMAVPTLVLTGDRDIVTKDHASETIQRRLPHGRLQSVKGVNHMGFLERSDAYNSAIAEFAHSVLTRSPAPAPAAASR